MKLKLSSLLILIGIIFFSYYYVTNISKKNKKLNDYNKNYKQQPMRENFYLEPNVTQLTDLYDLGNFY